MNNDIPEWDEIDLTLIELIDWLREWGVSARQAREIVDERVDEAFRIHAAEYP